MTEFLDHPETVYLAAGVETLRDLFLSRGFTFEADAAGVSSGGPFATGRFRKGDLEIGLIVRNKARLGCPNYTVRHGFAGHSDLVWALGHEGNERLVPGDGLEFVARDGTNNFLALRSDLESFILPALDGSEVEFRSALAAAVKRGHARLGF